MQKTPSRPGLKTPGGGQEGSRGFYIATRDQHLNMQEW